MKYLTLPNLRVILSLSRFQAALICVMAPGSDAWGLIVNVKKRRRSDLKLNSTFAAKSLAFFFAQLGHDHDLQGTRQSAILRPVLQAS